MINWRDIRHREFKKSSYDGDTPQLFSQNGNSKFSTKRNPVLGVLKIVCFHSFAKFRREDRGKWAPLAESQITLWMQTCEWVPGNSHEGAESCRKCFSHCLHLITHIIIQPSTQSLLKSAFTCSVIQKLFICKTCLDSCSQAGEAEASSGAQMCYSAPFCTHTSSTCSGRQAGVITGCSGTGSLLCKHSTSPAFSALSPPPSSYFSLGLQHYQRQLSPNIS